MANNDIRRQIFIGGCGRSGTTMLGAMLGAHSDCICSPESHFKISVLRARDWNLERVDLAYALNVIRKHWRFKIWDMPLDQAALSEAVWQDTYASLLERIVAQYGAKIDKSNTNTWVDHTPSNVRYAPRLLEVFPQAKFIHVVRDGRAVAASIMPLDWGPNSIIGAAHWWLAETQAGLAMETLLPPDRISRIRYEDLVTQPEQRLSDLCAFLGIEYQPQMAMAGGFTPPKYTAHQHTLIGSKPDAKRVTRWQTKLSPRQIELFESLTFDYLHYLGYPLEYGSQALPANAFEYVANAATELVRRVVVNPVRWLTRSYPVWVSPDFLETTLIPKRR
jgi:hypothetical protein